MHTVELLERMMDVAQQSGYTVRMEWLGGVGGGACEFAGRKWIFVDLALSVAEQLEQVASAVCNDPAVQLTEMPISVRLHLRRHDQQKRRAA